MKFNELVEQILDKKHSKQEVKYTLGKEKYKCLFCKHFKDPNKCGIVEGLIHRNGLCSEYEYKYNDKFNPNLTKFTEPKTPIEKQSPALKQSGGLHSDPVIAQTPV